MDPSENTSRPAPESLQRERRVYRRAQCWGTAGVKVLPEGGIVMGYLIDLAQGGCSIDADEPFPVALGGRVEALLQLDGFTLRLAGEVVRREENDTMLGIKFVDVSPRKTEQIEQLMEAIRAAERERKAGQLELGG